MCSAIRIVFINSKEEDLRKNLGQRDCKIQQMQELKPLDHLKRCEYGEQAENKIALDTAFKSKISINDVAHFCLSD